MISFKTGNLLEAHTDALVNAVNTVGVMGKGIALEFRKAYPENFRVYFDAVKSGKFNVGEVLVVPVETAGPVKFVVNFSTKSHWRFPSRLEWIQSGLIDLRVKIQEYGIKSIAIPRLGCGLGGLDWSQVLPLIEKEMGELDTEVVIYSY